MGFNLGGIEAYLNQLQYGNAGQAAKTTNQQVKTESSAAEEMGMTPKADRKDGFAKLDMTDTNTISLKQENAQPESKKKMSMEEIIRDRLERGERLTGSEMQYLRNNDPVLYQKAQKIQNLREKFSDILLRAPKSQAAGIQRDVLSHAQNAKKSDAETGEMLVKAIQKDYADYRTGQLRQERQKSR